MKRQPPKNLKLPLGEEIEAIADNALISHINKAMDFVEDSLKQVASQGRYAVSIYHSDIAEYCGAKEERFGSVLTHIESWLVEEGVQVVSMADNQNMLSLAWGVGKFPDGFKSISIEGVRG